MQSNFFLILCGHYLAEQNCSKTEIQVFPSLSLVPIFSYYIFKEVSLLARNLQSTSLPLTSSSHSVWPRRCYTHRYIGTNTCVCTRILPTPFFTASLKEHPTYISAELLNPPGLRWLEFKQNRLAGAYQFEEHLSKYKSKLCLHLRLIRKSW